MGHLNGILAQVGGNLNNNFQKSQMPRGLPGGGMLKLRFDRYINIVKREQNNLFNGSNFPQSKSNKTKYIPVPSSFANYHCSVLTFR